MLDHLSGGRFEFGFGFGEGVSAPSNFLWGLDPDEATGRTEEMITLLLEAFQSDGDFSFDGDFYRFENVPPPVAARHT